MISRRAMLTGMGALAAGALWGCDVDKNGPRLVADLPDAHGGFGEVPHGSPPPAWAPPKVVVPPPPRPKDFLETEAGPVYPRSGWTSAGPISSKLQPMDGVKLITFHHSGDAKPFFGETVADTVNHLEIARAWHIQSGFADIGYHFAIDRAGRVWQLRSAKYEGQHVADARRHITWNPHNLAVVVLGNFDLQSPSEAQKQKIVTFAKFLRKHYALPLSEMYTHQELKKTACPGRNMQPFMVTVRQRKLV